MVGVVDKQNLIEKDTITENEAESHHKQKVEQKHKNKKKRQLRDKLVFNLNFILSFISIAVIFNDPKNFIYINAISVIIMMAHRTYEFFCYKWQFFLIDFCYLVNYMVIIYSLFFKTNNYLFMTSFAFAFGPIFLAIPIYRFSYVFHNTVKFTSLWTHLSPSITMFIIRWFDNDVEILKLNEYSFDFNFILNFYYECSIYYFTWAIIYYIIVFHLAHDYILRKKCSTQYTYILNDKNNSPRLNIFGEKCKGLAYMFLHFRWVFLCLTLSLVSFFYFYVGLFVIIVLCLIPIWYSSTYYIDYFSENYHKQFKEADAYDTPI